MRMVAVVLGGGTGQRIGAALPKQLLRLAGRTLLEHCVAAFEQAPGVDEILVVMADGYVEAVRAVLAGGGYRKVTGVIAGGVARPDSTRVALAAIAASGLDPADCGVLLHDAARPLVDQRIIADCVAALGVHEAAGVAVPASDTIVITNDGVMRSMPRLRYLPDVSVHIVPGNERNLKITYPQDLAVAEALLAEEAAGPGEQRATDERGALTDRAIRE